VTIDLSRIKMPQDDEELLMLLGTWSMMPFLSEKNMEIASKVVPIELCKKCMGESSLFQETDTLPPHWPL
jgi:hypothetical protein